MTDPKTKKSEEGAADTSFAERAGGVVSERLASRTSRSAQDLVDLADALRLTSRQLESNFASPMIKRAADRLEHTAELLNDANPREWVDNLERFARREPLLFVGGALALGLLGGRFLRSSAERESSSSKTRAKSGRRSQNGQRNHDVEPQAE